MAEKPNAQEKLVKQVFAQIQKEYAQQQSDEAANLHNQFAAIIGEMKPSHTSLLLVLEILKQEVLGNLIDKMEQVRVKSQEIPEKKLEEVKPEENKPHSSGGGVG